MKIDQNQLKVIISRIGLLSITLMLSSCLATFPTTSSSTSKKIVKPKQVNTVQKTNVTVVKVVEADKQSDRAVVKQQVQQIKTTAKEEKKQITTTAKQEKQSVKESAKESAKTAKEQEKEKVEEVSRRR